MGRKQFEMTLSMADRRGTVVRCEAVQVAFDVIRLEIGVREEVPKPLAAAQMIMFACELLEPEDKVTGLALLERIVARYESDLDDVPF